MTTNPIKKNEAHAERHRINKEYRSIKRKQRESLTQMPHEGLVNYCMQVRWERDIAVKQLEELGYSLGQKIVPDNLKEQLCEILKDYDPNMAGAARKGQLLDEVWRLVNTKED